MRFTDEFKAERPNGADWYDTHIDVDTALYVNPFLLYQDEDPLWQGSSEEVASYFQIVMDTLRLARGDEKTSAWAKAWQMLHFPEPPEFALGMSMGNPDGNGIGKVKAIKMCRDIVEAGYLEVDDTLIGQLVILTSGIGVDGISDMVCNILKRRFIEYTAHSARALGVALTRMEVKNSGWDKSTGMWRHQEVEVPFARSTGRPVLLAPERFLDAIPRVEKGPFWSWAESNIGERLRTEFNFDLSVKLDQKLKEQRARELARKSQAVMRQYVGEAAEESEAYDMENDPELLVGWDEAGIAAAEELGLRLATPMSQEEFEEWLVDLASAFKHAVEENGLWRALWDEGHVKPRQEKIVQAVARSIWIHYCKANDIALSKENDCGKGSVDFTFSHGYKIRGLLEIKLMSSNYVKRGAESQLTQYLKSEKASFGVYLCVGFKDREMEDENIETIKEVCEAASAQAPFRLVPVIVDARPKQSASKI